MNTRELLKHLEELKTGLAHQMNNLNDQILILRKELEDNYPKDKILFFTKSNCGQCFATKRKLDAEGLEYVTFSLEEQEHYDYVTGAGFHQAPVVITPHRRWSGFHPEFIEEVAREGRHG